MATMTSSHHTLDQTPGLPSPAQHHLGPLPRILTVVAFAIALAGSIWSVRTADPSVEFSPGGTIAGLLIQGGITVAIANPKQQNRGAIAGIWAMVTAYVGMVLGGGMIGIVDALAPHLALPGWGEPWYGLGVLIAAVSFLLWVVAILALLYMATVRAEAKETRETIALIQRDLAEREKDHSPHDAGGAG